MVEMAAGVVDVRISKPTSYYGIINLSSSFRNRWGQFFGEPERASYSPIITLNNWHFDVQPLLSYIMVTPPLLE